MLKVKVRIMPFLKSIIILLILFLAFYLRKENYDTVPHKGESWDEYSYTWVGLSLIKLGVPVGISGIDGYTNEDVRYINVDRVFQSTANGVPTVINKPWFDHPPLLGLLTGFFAQSKGVEVFEEAGTFIIRKPMIFLGTLSVFLLMIIAWIHFDFFTATLAGLIYATVPIVVISSRMVQGENGVIPLMLLSYLFFSLFFKQKKYIYLFLSGVSAGLACLMKLSGISAWLTVSLLLLLEKNKSFNKKIVNIGYFSSIVFSFVSVFFLYGAFYDWSLFQQILRSNSNRFYGIGPEAIFNLITQTKITNIKTMTDAWPMAGWLAWFLIAKESKRSFGEQLIFLALISYLAIYLLFGNYPYGWYALPFWPVLFLALARLFSKNLFKYKNQTVIFLLSMIPFGFGISRLVDITSFQKYSFFWRYFLFLFLLLASLLNQTEFNKTLLYKKLFTLFIILLLSFSLYMNVKYLSLIDVDFWYKIN